MKALRLLLTCALSLAIAAPAYTQAPPFNRPPVVSGGGGMTIGSAVTGGCAYCMLFEDSSQNLATTSGFTFGAATGEGLRIPAGTATTDVPALAVTRTNNNAAVATGVKFTFTDTTSAAGFLPLQILGGSAATTTLLSVSKAGLVTAGTGVQVNTGTASEVVQGVTYINGAVTIVDESAQVLAVDNFDGAKLSSNKIFGWVSNATPANTTADTSFSRIAAGVVGIGTTGAAGSVAGTVAATNYRVASTPVILGTAPTLASGGCTSPTAVTANGTAAFSIGVGTSCSGSQPLVFTLPAATTGWICHGVNTSNAATSSPRQTGAVSTTSVTITNFSETTGLAAAWTNSDNVVVSCMGY